MFCIQINNVKLHKKAQTPTVIISTCTKMHADVLHAIVLTSVLRCGRLFGNSGACSACGQSIPASELVMRAQGNVYHLKVRESDVKLWIQFQDTPEKIITCVSSPTYLPASSSACQKTLIVLHWPASACFEVFNNGIKCCTFQASFWSFLCPSLLPPTPSVLHVPPVGTGLSPGIDFTTLTAACSANTTDLQHS